MVSRNNEVNYFQQLSARQVADTIRANTGINSSRRKFCYAMFRRTRKPYEAPKRRKPLERVGKAGTIRLYGETKSKLREDVWHRSGGFCELKLQGCNGYTPWKDGHLHHVRSRGASGSDSAENCKWTCPNCHFLTHQYGPSGEKPCKSKSEAGRG